MFFFDTQNTLYRNASTPLKLLACAASPRFLLGGLKSNTESAQSARFLKAAVVPISFSGDSRFFRGLPGFLGDSRLPQCCPKANTHERARCICRKVGLAQMGPNPKIRFCPGGPPSKNRLATDVTAQDPPPDPHSPLQVPIQSLHAHRLAAAWCSDVPMGVSDRRTRGHAGRQRNRAT